MERSFSAFLIAIVAVPIYMKVQENWEMRSNRPQKGKHYKTEDNTPHTLHGEIYRARYKDHLLFETWIAESLY